MKETYKDYQITYNENLGKFRAVIGDSNYENASLASVKKYIDRLDKKDFKRVDVIVDDYQGLSDGTVTSYPEGQEHSGFKQCWVSFKDTNRRSLRSKISITTVFPDNPHNREIIRQVKEKLGTISTTEKEIAGLKEGLEPYKP